MAAEDVRAAAANVATASPRGVVAWKGLVLVCVGTPVNHWLYTPAEARDLAALLIEKARAAELQQESEPPAAGRNEELGTVE